ncbi:Eos1 protein [Pichia kluyveri]|uniref:Eos1 protein n=1 Tax=Pichia kluyveri TaxID=36015 RepID=A0AAV5QY77_PICKL|nr:Eos1 protein [Pichia kluyveri]
MSQIPLYSDEMRMRRHIRNLNLESDYDSEYANHPPPTDSEIERIYPGQNGKSINRNNNIDPIPDYRTEEDIPAIHRNSSYNRLHNNNHQNPNNSNGNNLIGSSRNLLYGISSTAMEDLYKQRNKLKDYGLRRLNIKQHIIVTICRDIPLYSMLKSFIILISQWIKLIKIPYNNVITVRATEFFLASLWCLVSALLSYIILDGLMIRWMIMYDIKATIVRILSMSLMIIMIIEMFNYTFNNADNEFCLTVWILISCVLTIIFIIQCFQSNNSYIDNQFNSKAKDVVESIELLRNRSNSNNHNRNNSNSYSINNINEEMVYDNANDQSNSGITEISKVKKKFKRKIDLYNLVVFAVVPIGVASFISTIGLVRLLLILRLDVSMEISRIQQHIE